MKLNIKERIRNEYVHGYIKNGQRIMPTLDDLIEKHNVASSTTYRYSAKEGWKEQRKSFSKQLTDQYDQKQLTTIKHKLSGNMRIRQTNIPKHLQHLPRKNLKSLLYLFGKTV